MEPPAAAPSDDLFDLSGKVAVVTGGSRSLGAAMVRAFAQRGADLVIASRKAEACDRLAGEIAAATGRSCFGAGYHAAHWNQADELAELAYKRFRPLRRPRQQRGHVTPVPPAHGRG
jgi:NAD(P)-dependent dehydrogenase (short-subunit alcohol dehydrogenase family)